MPVFTPILNLLKKVAGVDPPTDTFNIQTMMNDNWDKVDQAIGLKNGNADVRVATTGDLALSGEITVDGVVLKAGDRVLVKAQTDKKLNGIYIVSAAAWKRSPDADASEKLAAGLSVFVREGSAGAGTAWRLTGAGKPVLGTSDLSFTQLGSPLAATATPGTVALRDGAGRLKAAAPSASDDVARKDTVDSAVSSLQASLNAAVTPLQADLANAAPVNLSLVPGTQTITVPRDNLLNVTSIRGRTLVNLIGRVGNMDFISNWPGSNVTVTSDTTNFTTGTSGAKLTIGSGTTKTFYLRGDTGLLAKAKAGRYYIGIMDIKSGTSALTSIKINVGSGAASNNTITTSKFTAVWGKYTPATDENCGIQIDASSASSGQILYADSARIYEVTLTEYTALNSMTADQIAAKYPYVDDVKNVNGIYIRRAAAQAADDQYQFFPDANLASNLDGSIFDELYTDSLGQARVKRWFKTIDLTGDLAWQFSGNYTGFKEVRLDGLIQAIPNTFVASAIKNNGKILDRIESTKTAMDQFGIHSTAGTLFLTIASSDSGWGDNYTPTAEEINAYFNGWVMFNGGATTNSTPDNPANNLYNGSGQKAWVRRFDGVSRGWLDGTTSLPVLQATSFSPYRLLYQLTNSIDEPARSEGAVNLYEGINTIEVGTGVVVKEKANFELIGGYWQANEGAYPSTYFKYRSYVILDVFKSRKRERNYILWSNGSYGNVRPQYAQSHYDNSAVYEVTYLTLDTCQIGIIPALISAQYVPNSREIIDSLVKITGQLTNRLAVLENNSATDKAPQWIYPTLLNSWRPYENKDRYKPSYKKVGNTLEIKGVICGGINFAPIFILPREYRPASTYHGPIVSVINATYGLSNLCVDVDGRVFVSISAASNVTGEN